MDENLVAIRESAIRDEDEQNAPAGDTIINQPDEEEADKQGVDNNEGERDDDDELAGELQHLLPRAKTKAERAAAKGKKAGNQGRFQGPQREFLSQHVERYLRISAMKEGKNGKLDEFWEDIRSGFWATFTWKEVREEMGPLAAQLPKERVVLTTNKVCRVSKAYERAPDYVSVAVDEKLLPLANRPSRRRRQESVDKAADGFTTSSRSNAEEEGSVAGLDGRERGFSERRVGRNGAIGPWCYHEPAEQGCARAL